MNDVETQVYAVLLKGHHWFSVEDIAFELDPFDPSEPSKTPGLLTRRNIQRACNSLYTNGLVGCEFVNGTRPFYYRALSPHEIAESKMKGVSLDSSHE